MAFDKTLMARATTSFSDGKTAVYWTYGPSAVDSIATITASAYFDEWTDQVNKDDYLYLVGTDGQDIRAFTSVLGVVPVTVAAFITAGDIADGSITTPKLAALAVTTAKIAASAVTATELNTDAVTSVKILADAVTTAKIATGAVTSNELGTDAVTSVKILADAVTTVKILDANVTQAKIAPNTLNAVVAKNLENTVATGVFPILFRVLTPGGASLNTDLLMTEKVRILDVIVNIVGTGTTSDTVTIQNVTTPLTDAMDVSGSANAIVRNAELITAQVEVAASTNLRVAQVDGGGSDSPSLEVLIVAARIA